MQRPVRPVSRTARAAVRRVHRSLCARLAAARAMADAMLAQEFASIVAAVESGLRHEEVVLQRMGHVDLHVCMEDNAVLLRALHRVLPRVEDGEAALGREVLAALHDVLALRRIACDVALAALGSPVHAGPPALRARQRPLMRHEGRRTVEWAGRSRDT